MFIFLRSQFASTRVKWWSPNNSQNKNQISGGPRKSGLLIFFNLLQYDYMMIKHEHEAEVKVSLNYKYYEEHFMK
jgi:hypothetical protein